MNTTIGTGQTSLANNSLAVSTVKSYYIARFVSPLLGQSSIAANTWTLSYAATQSNIIARFPFQNVQPTYLSIYVWRTSTQTVLGSIFDGASANISRSAVTTELSVTATVSGSAVSSINSGDDVIICEMWARVTQAAATSYTQTFYFDGTTENATNNTTVSNHASYISTPETITFYTGPPPPVDTTVTGKTIYNKTTRHG